MDKPLVNRVIVPEFQKKKNIRIFSSIILICKHFKIKLFSFT